MELKWTRAGGFAVGPARSNRTFMELKYRLLHLRGSQREVLIAPLWN